jgi:hypothetical protein
LLPTNVEEDDRRMVCRARLEGRKEMIEVDMKN